MGFCANTSCGQAYIKWKALKEMNAKGIYSPEQIDEQNERVWSTYNPDDSTFVNKETCQKMVEDAVNALGSIGDGKTFDAAEYDKVYKTVDKLKAGKIIKHMVLAMVTGMVAKNA